MTFSLVISAQGNTSNNGYSILNTTVSSDILTGLFDTICAWVSIFG